MIREAMTARKARAMMIKVILGARVAEGTGE